MTILNRLARAIWEANNAPTDSIALRSMPKLQNEAQAAIKVVCDALREPSEEMAIALYKGLTGNPVLGQEDNYSRAVPALRALADHLEGK